MHAMAILDRRRLAEIYAGSRDAGSSSGSSNAPKPSSKPIPRKSKMCSPRGRNARAPKRRPDGMVQYMYMFRAERSRECLLSLLHSVFSFAVPRGEKNGRRKGIARTAPA